MLCVAIAGRGSVSIYRNHIYPHLVSRMGDPKPIREIRQRLVRLAHGTVLEIGAGSGANFVHYDPARVAKLYALEPNQGMIALAERQRCQTKLDVEFLDLPGERIPLENESVDSIVSTFTLGTIPDVLAALRGIGRVLRPGGKLIFFELGLSPDPRVRSWQKWCDPIAHWLFEGLHLTRDIPSILTQSGFEVESVETMYFAAFPKSWTYGVWGTAIRSG
jgi:ubiquinone/menaquinone biosynthesis C-methylase UbiE